MNKKRNYNWNSSVTKFGSERPRRKGIYTDKIKDLGFDY